MLGTEEGLRIAIAKIEEAERGFDQPVRLVVFDTLTRLSGRSGLSMVDVQDFGKLLDGISSVGKPFKASTLTLAHSPKSDPHNPSGTFQLGGNADCVIKATRIETTGAELADGPSLRQNEGRRDTSGHRASVPEARVTELLAQSLAARGKDGLDPDNVFVEKYTSLACVWDGGSPHPSKTFAVDSGSTRKSSAY